MQKFEKGFFVGAATAAHQVEGNNIHSDYWAQEQLPHTSFTEPSGIACDHYNCLLYTSPSPRDRQKSRMPSSA